ncbi:hypothetical protein HYFRA_00006372 [Hymenoscyphus fraxineus]|uniref:NmrA-like domain-containing protein n=1 Tax=Hymenoscyphus fraxineus TaxID=746836 RepID=A0A9N9PPF0_9HELO|nr:hypothetical protein HYFRA_00006372 [Hymenoscyphus fraxineus]
MTSIYVVTAATGAQGSSTARALIAAGATVRAIVRDVNAPVAKALQELGAVLFEGDFDSLDTIKDALSGATGLFYNPFPTPTIVGQANAIISLAKATSTIKTVVLSTVFYCGSPAIWDYNPTDSHIYLYYKGKFEVEKVLKAAGFENYTILRPAWIMHNYILPHSSHHFPELSEKAELAHLYPPETEMSHVDPQDIGKFAAAAFLKPEQFREEEIELGYENLTIEKARATLSKVLGFEVTQRRRSAEEEVAMEQVATTQPFQRLAINKPLTIDGQALERKFGIKMTGFEDYCLREKEALVRNIHKA